MTCYEMSQQIEEYMVYCCSKQLSRKTMASYEQSLRLFEKWCRDTMKIDDVALVTEAVIRRYITSPPARPSAGRECFLCEMGNGFPCIPLYFLVSWG